MGSGGKVAGATLTQLHLMPTVRIRGPILQLHVYVYAASAFISLSVCYCPTDVTQNKVRRDRVHEPANNGRSGRGLFHFAHWGSGST